MEMNDNSNDLGAFLAGFIVGALVGAATALILAPQSGSATRQQLADMSHDLRRSADSHARQYADRAGTLVSDTRDRAQHLTEQVQDQVRIVLDKGKDQTAEAVDSLNNGDGAVQG
jgi:gas vesicle protein